MTLLESGMSGWAVTGLTVVIIALSAFFVAVEFALMSSRQHRLEERAGTLAGRAALRNSAELTLILAGSQLGITVCTLALGAITKPAVHHALMPLFELVGMPSAAADAASFLLALFIVTFLHLVIGEMAPKSWAIAHPEKSAVLLALPMRAFMWGVKPLLRAMNGTANGLLRLRGIEPVDELSSGQDIDGLRHLVEHSASVGVLDLRYRSSLTAALRLRDQTVREMMPADQVLAVVAADASAADVREVSRATGHLRVLVREGVRTVGVVHVRDTLNEPDDRPALDLARPPIFVAADTGLAKAMRDLREAHAQLAVITEGDDELGVVTLADVLPGLMPSAIVTRQA